MNILNAFLKAAGDGESRRRCLAETLRERERSFVLT